MLHHSRPRRIDPGSQLSSDCVLFSGWDDHWFPFLEGLTALPFLAGSLHPIGKPAAIEFPIPMAVRLALLPSGNQSTNCSPGVLRTKPQIPDAYPRGCGGQQRSLGAFCAEFPHWDCIPLLRIEYPDSLLPSPSPILESPRLTLTITTKFEKDASNRLQVK